MNKLVQTRYGPMYISTLDRCVHRSLERYGEWAQLEIEPILKLLRPTDIVLDIGANIGTHTIAIAPHVRAVMAFEPQPPTFQMLCANVVANYLRNVTTMAFAVGEKECVASMEVIDWEASDNNYGGARVYTQPDPTRAPIGMLSIDQLKLPACDFIKCDIEGGELAMIAGAKETIRKFKPIMYLEAHDKDRPDLVDAVKALDYRVYLHSCSPFNPENFNGAEKESDMFGSYIERNILCVPAGRELKTNLEQL